MTDSLCVFGSVGCRINDRDAFIKRFFIFLFFYRKMTWRKCSVFQRRREELKHPGASVHIPSGAGCNGLLLPEGTCRIISTSSTPLPPPFHPPPPAFLFPIILFFFNRCFSSRILNSLSITFYRSLSHALFNTYFHPIYLYSPFLFSHVSLPLPTCQQPSGTGITVPGY